MATRDAVAHQPADGIEAGVLVRAEAVLRLQIEDERHAGGVGNLADARLEAGRVARVAAGQHHRACGTRAAAAAAPGRWRGRTTGPRLGIAQRDDGNTREPAEQRFVLVERDVVEEGVAAVEEARDAAGLDVPRHAFGRVEVERALGVALARQRRDGEDAGEIVQVGWCSCPEITYAVARPRFAALDLRPAHTQGSQNHFEAPE